MCYQLVYCVTEIHHWSVLLSSYSECPEGVFGIMSVMSCFSFYRISVRSSCFYHCVFIAVLTLGLYLADLIMVIGILDIVFGEVDR